MTNVFQVNNKQARTPSTLYLKKQKPLLKIKTYEVRIFYIMLQTFG